MKMLQGSIGATERQLLTENHLLDDEYDIPGSESAIAIINCLNYNKNTNKKSDKIKEKQ